MKSLSAKIKSTWLAGLLVLMLAAPVVLAASEHQAEATKALAWMKTQQAADGSFAGLGAGSTVDALLAIVAAGQDPATYANGGKTPVDFLQSKAADLAKTPGGAGKLLIAVAALGMDGKPFGGVNLVNAINATYDAPTGHYGKDAIGHAFAMLGLKAAGETVPAKATDYLKQIQTSDGGWAFTGDTKAGSEDTNSTAVAIQALVAAGEPTNSDVMKKAKSYLSSQSNADGGFPYQKGGEFGSQSDVDSTAYVAQAFDAVGETAFKGLQFIVSMQNRDGAFEWESSEKNDNPEATYQAIPALLGATLADPKAAMSEAPVPTGMPTTGSGQELVVIVAMIALATLFLGAGIVARRKSLSS